MTTRRDELEGLRVASPCRSPWGEMRGDGRRRHCAQCDRHVYDFAQLTEREAAGLIEATGGRLCARLTRDGAGRLVTLAPPTVAGEPFAPRRGAPLVAAAVAAVLGLTGVAWTGSAAVTPPAAEHETEKQPAKSPPQKPAGAGGSLSGTLATEAGELIANAEVKLQSQLDRQERTGRTDAQGRFSFASLPAGIYRLHATWRGSYLAYRENVLLRTGEAGEVGMTVANHTWERVTTEPLGGETGGAIVLTADPIRKLYDDAGVVVLGVAGRSEVTRREEYTSEVRTDLVVSSVVKGETRERVISIFHQQRSDEDVDGRWRPGDRMLAFLDPREAENGRGLQGYVAHTSFGLKTLSETELPAYGHRLEELARIERHGAARPADIVEWLVGTAEEPATRREAIRELGQAVWQLERESEQGKVSMDGYAEDVRDVLADFLAAGGTLAGDADSTVLAAYFTAAQRERLTAALLRTTHVTSADLDLYGLVSPWHDGRLLPWLIDRVKAGETSSGSVRPLLSEIAKAVGDPALKDLLAAEEKPLDALEETRWKNPGEAEEARLAARIAAGEEALRQKFLAAMGRRPGA